MSRQPPWKSIFSHFSYTSVQTIQPSFYTQTESLCKDITRRNYLILVTKALKSYTLHPKTLHLAAYTLKQSFNPKILNIYQWKLKVLISRVRNIFCSKCNAPYSLLMSLGSMHGILCRMSWRVEEHLIQRWGQHPLKHTHWLDGYPKTCFGWPFVTIFPFHSLFFSLKMQFHRFFHTWTHPNGSILHPHHLIQPYFLLTKNNKPKQNQSSIALSSSSPLLLPDHHLHCNSPNSSSPDPTFKLMENSYIPLLSTTSTPTATNSTSNIRGSQSSEFSTFEPMNLEFHHPSQLVPPYQRLSLSYSHSMEQAPLNPFTMGQIGFEFGERRNMDSYRTKLARINRKLARQRSLSLQRNATSGTSNQVDTRRFNNFGANNMKQNNDNRREYKFCAPDNKRLRLLLRKELKNSDVGSLGRIVLPKREAEVNLPRLSDKEGIQVTIKDVYSSNEWTLKYKFWTNNKSRMYVLENTGNFVKQNQLRSGDSLSLYEDESNNLYFSITKVATVVVESSSNQHCYDTVNNNNNNDNNNNNRDMYLPFTSQYKEDGETSLELFKEHGPNDSMMTLLVDAEETVHLSTQNVDSYGKIQTSATLLGGISRSVGDISMNLDDCYSDLDMLPDVTHYNFSL